MTILRRALADTFSGVWKPGIVGILGFGITFYLVLQDAGWDAAVAEAELWIFSAIGSLGALLLLFAWNLVCTPYRIEREKNQSAVSEIASLKKEIEHKSTPR